MRATIDHLNGVRRCGTEFVAGNSTQITQIYLLCVNQLNQRYLRAIFSAQPQNPLELENLKVRGCSYAATPYAIRHTPYAIRHTPYAIRNTPYLRGIS